MTRTAFAIGFAAGLIEHAPGPWPLRRRIIGAVLSLNPTPDSTDDGYDLAVSRHPIATIRAALGMDDSRAAEILTWTDEPELLATLGEPAPVFTETEIAAARLRSDWNAPSVEYMVNVAALAAHWRAKGQIQ